MERIARNEATFRSTNELLHGGLQAVPRERGERAGYVCECGDVGCTVLVHLDFGEYEWVRADPRRFLLVPGHQVRGAEAVVRTSDRHVVVEKPEVVGPVTEAAAVRLDEPEPRANAPRG